MRLLRILLPGETPHCAGPAHRPLVQTNKLAKAKLAAWRKAQSEKLDAKKEAVK